MSEVIDLTKLEDYCELIVDCPHSTPVWTDSGVIVIRNQNIKNGVLDLSSPSFTDMVHFIERTRRARPRGGDLIFTREAPMGEICMVPNDLECCVGQRQVLLRAKKTNDSSYLLYAFQTPFIRKQIDGHRTTGSTVSNFCIPDLKKLLVPRIPNESKVASVLSALDAKISLNHRINAELEGMAKLLYDYWFVQFDFPMSAAQAAAHGKPRLAGHPYQSSGGKMTYHPTLKRELPEGWKASTIGETFTTNLGGTPSRKEPGYWNPDEVAWLSSGEKAQLFVCDPDEYISRKGLANSPATLLPAGSIILSIVRHIRASILGIAAATNQSVLGIKETDKIKHCFIYPFIMGEIPHLMKLRTGAQQPHINKGTVDERPLVIPDDATLKAYSAIAAPVFEQIKNQHQQNQHLTALRDWLLPMLMNGQVTVR